jgi:hypothetical protein
MVCAARCRAHRHGVQRRRDGAAATQSALHGVALTVTVCSGDETTPQPPRSALYGVALTVTVCSGDETKPRPPHCAVPCRAHRHGVQRKRD